MDMVATNVYPTTSVLSQTQDPGIYAQLNLLIYNSPSFIEIRGARSIAFN